MRIQLIACLLSLALAGQAAAARQPQVPSNGPKGTVIHETNLYVDPATSATRLTTIMPGREIVIIEHNGPWLRVFANTDAQISREDAPVFGATAADTPVSGWIEQKGVVDATTPKGDLILFGVAATEELEASHPHAPASAAQAARLLYQRMVDFFPQSPLAPEAAWRTADIRWQLEKADIFSLPSAHEKQAYMREQIDETEMRKLQKTYPRSNWADLAAWDMLDNKVCGDWQGSPQCPEKEAGLYEKYAEDHPDSSKAPEALYEAAYREGVLHDMYGAMGDDKKAQAAEEKAISLANDIESKYSRSDYAARGAGLIYKLESSIPIYGLDRE